MHFHGNGDRFSPPVLLPCQESHSHSNLLRCKHAFQNKEGECLNTPKTNSLALSSVQYNCIFLRGCFFGFFSEAFPSSLLSENVFNMRQGAIMENFSLDG